MEIRVIGTKEECETAASYYGHLEGDVRLKSISISKLYPSRYSKQKFRIYIEMEYYTAVEVDAEIDPVKELDLGTIHNAHLSAKGWKT